MASVLILSRNGDGVPIGLRLAQEGHVVKFYFRDDKAKASLKGYRNPSIVGDPRRMLDQYDLVIADMAKLGELCTELTDKGKLVLGGGVFNDKLELDREYGEKVIAKLCPDCKIPPTVKCTTPEEIIDHLESAGRPQVIKPLGNKPVGLTLVSTDPSNRTSISIIRERGKDCVPCIIQERINGIEISTEGWFNGKAWVLPFNHTMEKKRFLVSDKGPNTGCMGNVVWPSQSNKLTKAILEPLSPLLEKVNYIGPIDVNCIVTSSAAWFLEFTPRFGYEAIQTWGELLKCSLFDYFWGIATQSKTDFPVYEGYGIGVRLSVSPYPSEEDIEKWNGVQVIDLPKEAEKHVWLADVMKENGGVPVLAGVDGVIGCVTARGSDVHEARRRVYRTVRSIVITDDVQYRTDIGDGVEDQKRKLMEWGWLNNG